ncbi:DUF2326 domain-containing protein [Spirochaetia bacterium 38H-sp]|uniref:DUF2326 domain-containing protein n=1 Tax=Rarispira pelagica TaxID=3141764 RepID=A0ABU9UEH1_9SPIR
MIIDETKTSDRKESGNNVGKTTVLRLIDFCLGGKGENIYKDPEFKEKGSNTIIENFLKNNNVIITLVLKEDLELEASNEIVIRRNFLSSKNKIQEINGERFNNKDFLKKLKELIFNSKSPKPTFRQIIAKNIRDEKSRLINTIKVLHPTTKHEEYEALYFFWLGIPIDEAERKQQLHSLIKIEEDLQRRLKKEYTLSQIEQSLIIINRNIEQLEKKKAQFNLNEDYESDLEKLNHIKAKINRLSTQISQLELRKDLILESKVELEEEIANIDVEQIKYLYSEAKILVPDLQKSFEDTLKFHNEMLIEKKNYITKELPGIENQIKNINQEIKSLISQEKKLSELLQKSGALEELEKIVLELNKYYEQKGNLEEQKRLWNQTISNIEKYKGELNSIDKNITSKEDLLNERITIFNKYFSSISQKLYGEQFVLSYDKNEKGFELNISTISGNPGTGKKKGQIAAFDLAYIQFADELGINCLHFILHDQIENVHDNQITSLLNEIVSNINCQYVLPVLRDKLPEDVDVDKYRILSLSQKEKLFKI